MKRLLSLVLCSLVWSGWARAESVVVTPSPDSLAAGGGQLVLNVDIVYGEAPAALGLSIGLPAGWSFVATSGAAKPAIQPDAGTTGSLDFAWMTAPADHAAFSITVSYPAGTGATTLRGKAILRRDGKSLDLPISVSVGG
jgi:hypothetical protein